MCKCPSCKETDALNGFKWDDAGQKRLPDEKGGFANWPRGKPAGRKSATDYAAHVRFGQNIGAREIPAAILTRAADAVSFYGSSPGLSREKVRAVLVATFAGGPQTLSDEAQV